MKIIRAVVFNPDSVEIQYMDDSDVRLDGNVFITRNITIARGVDHDGEIASVEESAQDLLTDVMQDFARSIPFDPSRYATTGEDDDE